MLLRRPNLSRSPLGAIAAFASLASLSCLSVHCGESAVGDDDASYGGPSYGGGDNGSSRGGGGSSGSSGNAPIAPAVPGAEPERDPDASPGEPMAAPACGALDSTKPLELYLSSDDSNSMASPVIARRIIREQRAAPSPGVLRTYEFLNYYNVNYGSVAPGTLGVDAQLRVNPAGEFELQVGVQAPPREVRRPMTLTFVLDTSGSMEGRPIELLKEAVRAAASQLEAGDVVSLLTWNTGNFVALSGHTATGPNDPAVLGALTGIIAKNGTDLSGGLAAGYRLAEQFDGPDRVNRIIVISDGVANVGVTDEQLIGAKANVQDKEGIYLVGVGVGEGVNDTLMDTVTDAGNGAYIYLDTKEEAWRMFGQRFAESVEVGARNVQVQAKLPWYLSMRRFYGEEYSTDPYVVKPQHLAPGDSMVISQVLVPCQGAPAADADPIEVIASWVEPLTYARKTATFASTVGELKASTRGEIARGKAIIAYAEWLKTFDAREPQARAIEARQVLALAAAAGSGTDPALAEIRELVGILEPSAIGGGPSVEP